MKKILLTVACCLTLGSTLAQGLPKWAGKAGKAVFSVITYNQDNKILNTGNGFYIDEQGTAVSDYTLFRNAHHAVIVNADGKELPVECILGANYLYDVVKFRTAVQKKSVALVPATSAAVGQQVYVLPYSTQKSKNAEAGTVSQVDTISNRSLYFTLNMATTDKTVSCPLMNAEGQVLGLMQKSADADSQKSYAIDIKFAQNLAITALSGTDQALQSIGIKKALPADESQALVYVYMNAARLSSDEYLALLNEFIAQFPGNVEGWIRRATYHASLHTDKGNQLAQEDINHVLKVNKDKAEAHYHVAKFIYSYAIDTQTENKHKEWTLDQALQHIDAALQQQSEPLYQQIKGDICFAQQKYQEAYDAYTLVNQSKLASALTYFSAAKSLEQVEGHAPASVLALLDSAIAQYTEPYLQEAAPYLLERARVHTGLEQYRNAVFDYNHAYEALKGQVAPDFHLIRYQVEVKAHMYPQAIEDINTAISKDPKNLDYLLEKASIHIRVNQTDEAIETLRKVLQLAPEKADAHRMLGYIYMRQKNKAEGKKHLNEAIRLGDEVAKKILEKYK